MRTILSAILISFLLSGCYNHYNNPEQSDNSLAAHTTISTLYPMCSVGVLTIEESLKVKGRVVSNDCDKYFNGELYIDDGTATAKLMIDQYSLYTRYPEGVEISVDLKGFAIAHKDHILQIGLPSANNKRVVDDIVSQATLNKNITIGNSISTLHPKEYNISELNTSLCGKLITTNRAVHHPADSTDTYFAGGYHRFCDRDSNFIHIYIDKNSSGAGRILPQEEISLTGIITCKTDHLRDSTTLIIVPRRDSDIWQ